MRDKDGNEIGTTELWIVDAKKMEVVCRVPMPQRVPYGGFREPRTAPSLQVRLLMLLTIHRLPRALGRRRPSRDAKSHSRRQDLVWRIAAAHGCRQGKGIELAALVVWILASQIVFKSIAITFDYCLRCSKGLNVREVRLGARGASLSRGSWPLLPG